MGLSLGYPHGTRYARTAGTKGHLLFSNPRFSIRNSLKRLRFRKNKQKYKIRNKAKKKQKKSMNNPLTIPQKRVIFLNSSSLLFWPSSFSSSSRVAIISVYIPICSPKIILGRSWSILWEVSLESSSSSSCSSYWEKHSIGASVQQKNK